ncbi:MAG: hypothetical protein JSC085_000557 [Candidatus Tokpelaia sp. JSC085]|nr:MAG: hypothetical protein JSC085_000557 [Candidatus Tokpelaia sp. JSC085]
MALLTRQLLNRGRCPIPNDNKKIWGIGGFRENLYINVERREKEDHRKLILPLTQWKQQVMQTCSATCENDQIGIFVAAGDDIEPLLPFLSVIPLLALDFPVFDDGRSYSKAVQLRTCHFYLGELRAVGDILIDQVSNMIRCGFDTLEVTHSLTQVRLAAHSGEFFTGFYQSGAKLVRSGQRRVWYTFG